VINTSIKKKKPKYSKVGKKIKKGLIDKNMTARELADQVGTSPQYLNKIIHGVRPGIKYLAEISRILEIDLAA
jgi:DNA-binding helix-turn-helix protein